MYIHQTDHDYEDVTINVYLQLPCCNGWFKRYIFLCSSKYRREQYLQDQILP
jgi:hypothetical protein